jgi:uncharacterized protein YcgI (DUF1989 family)
MRRLHSIFKLAWAEKMTKLLTIPAGHETLIAPCDNERYGLLGCTYYHDTCRENMHAGLAGMGQLPVQARLKRRL